jgi:hypothetical protein
MNAPHSAQARDAGLGKLTLIRRWLIAGSVTLTGVLTAVAAHAFPGKTVTPSGGQVQNSGQSSEASASSSSGSATQDSEASLGAPAQTPEAAESQEPATEAPVVSGGS